MSIRILIVDDDERWRRIVGDFLRNEGYSVLEAADGVDAVDQVRRSDLDLVILDIMMPNMDGIEACRAIREFSTVPILMVTARSDEESEVVGFVTGADEYVSKPVKFPVFIARIKALLKRSGAQSGQIEIADIVINPNARTVRVQETPINLTPREYDLLLYLAQNKNVALTREQILDAVWNFEYFGDARTVDTHIKNLRMKLGPSGSVLKTVRGRGYRMEDQP